MGKACVTSHQKASRSSFQVQLPAANERSDSYSRHCVDSLSWGLIQLPKKIGASRLVRGVVLRIGGVKVWEVYHSNSDDRGWVGETDWLALFLPPGTYPKKPREGDQKTTELLFPIAPARDVEGEGA